MSEQQDIRTGLFRCFSYLCRGNGYEELTGLRLVSSIDPLTGKRTVTLYTDDGHGNGDGVLILVDPAVVTA